MLRYLIPLINRAREFHSATFALENAKRLATGRIPVLIVLQEPCNSADHVPFAVMMYGPPETMAAENDNQSEGSNTLQETEDLIISTSSGRYDLSDCSLFDINLLLTAATQAELGNALPYLNAANNTFEDMVLALRPHIVISLQCEGRKSSNGFVKLLSSSIYRAGTVDVVDIAGADALLIRGFHPSTYLREDYTEEFSNDKVSLYREMLEYCFTIAFEALQGRLYHDQDVLNRWSQYYLSTCQTNENKMVRIEQKLQQLRPIQEQLRQDQEVLEMFSQMDMLAIGNGRAAAGVE